MYVNYLPLPHDFNHAAAEAAHQLLLHRRWQAAGHNALRGSGPNRKHAFKDALTHAVLPIPGSTLSASRRNVLVNSLKTSNAVVVVWPHLLESLWL
jgi:hypothetical protein